MLLLLQFLLPNQLPKRRAEGCAVVAVVEGSKRPETRTTTARTAAAAELSNEPSGQKTIKITQ